MSKKVLKRCISNFICNLFLYDLYIIKITMPYDSCLLQLGIVLASMASFIYCPLIFLVVGVKIQGSPGFVLDHR